MDAQAGEVLHGDLEGAGKLLQFGEVIVGQVDADGRHLGSWYAGIEWRWREPVLGEYVGAERRRYAGV